MAQARYDEGGAKPTAKERPERNGWQDKRENSIKTAIDKARKAEEARRKAWQDALNPSLAESDIGQLQVQLDVFKENIASAPEEFIPNEFERERYKKVYLAHATRLKLLERRAMQPGSSQYDISKNSIVNKDNLNNLQ